MRTNALGAAGPSPLFVLHEKRRQRPRAACHQSNGLQVEDHEKVPDIETEEAVVRIIKVPLTAAMTQRRSNPFKSGPFFTARNRSKPVATSLPPQHSPSRRWPDGSQNSHKKGLFRRWIMVTPVAARSGTRRTFNLPVPSLTIRRQFSSREREQMV